MADTRSFTKLSKLVAKRINDNSLTPLTYRKCIGISEAFGSMPTVGKVYQMSKS
jgi:hypothetical protein